MAPCQHHICIMEALIDDETQEMFDKLVDVFLSKKWLNGVLAKGWYSKEGREEEHGRTFDQY